MGACLCLPPWPAHLLICTELHICTDMRVCAGVQIPPCGLGEVPVNDGQLCLTCAQGLYSLTHYGWGDDDTTAAAGGGGQQLGVLELGGCVTCPTGAYCPGGAVVSPQSGYWHSAPDSPQMHLCPNPAACR